ncbi:hypothetical protein [Streptomyces jumonjinensis]|uniref:hypothetical protein n=1 Tax=Streptomyces jumonjinensis TaxID=1945 RepID=UPI00378F9722
MTGRRLLGAGSERPDPPARDPRARTAAERAVDGEWIAERASPAGGVSGGRRRTLGPGGGALQETPQAERHPGVHEHSGDNARPTSTP